MLDSVKNKNGRAVDRSPSHFEAAAELTKRWRHLVHEYLPYAEKDSTWRFSRTFRNADPKQGWKIHVSATVLSACDVFQVVAPYLQKIGIAFKAPGTLGDLVRINTGLSKSYCQVGKFVTIYPRSDDEFRKVLSDLHERIPRETSAPSVPFELRYKNSNIYFRYGAFIEFKGRKSKIEMPNGELVEDSRDVPCPEWINPPIESYGVENLLSPSPLSMRYRVFRSLSQRGKGGVYEAIDSHNRSTENVIIKEGRRSGETDWSGLDGRGKVIHEFEVLKNLHRAGVRVPEPIGNFEVECHQYLVLEKLAGKSLDKVLVAGKRRLRMGDTLYICKQISEIMEQIHNAGWIWRDCKPANLMLSDRNAIRPIDFEGACRIEQPANYFWYSPNFAAPEVLNHFEDGGTDAMGAADLFSLGVTLYFVIEGKLPPEILARQEKSQGRSPNEEVFETKSVEFSRRNVPKNVRQIISKLLSNNPLLRPSAETVSKVFSSD